MRSTARIDVLDILRGIALAGMFFVHFNDRAVAPADAGPLTAIYERSVALFFEERFWTMFGILFGVGFALQMRRAEERGVPFAAIYTRRLVALAAIGLLTHAVLGYHVLFEYAIWGFPLLLVRRWPLRRLVIALVLSAASWSIYTAARTSICVATSGDEACRAERSAAASAASAFRETNARMQNTPDYATVFRARLAHIAWFYAQPYSFLPVNTFTLFLIGVVALRLGFFDEPWRHRRTIAALAVCGAASWAFAEWTGNTAFGTIRTTWLAFTYIGVVLLLVAQDRRWLRRLAPFAWTGRMALTNYVAQIAVLDLTFSAYGGHVTPTPLQGLASACALFVVDAMICRWWLARFRFGPLEWLWRSITYGRPQPWRLAPQSHAQAVRV